jgi:tetratricopeptide (TPR) repeat protein
MTSIVRPQNVLFIEIMSRNQKPVVIVAIVLGALIILPLIILMISRAGGDAPQLGIDEASSKGNSTVVDFDLRQLADHAEKLLSKDLVDAVQKGDISLDFMAGLNKEANKARSALASGKLERAEQYYRSVVQTAEAQLAALALADQARALNDSTYTELQRLEYLQSAFINTYREAVETYNEALRSLNAGQYQKSVDDYEMTGAILGDLEARAIQQIGDILETAKVALEAYDLSAAKNAYQEVLRIDSANKSATEGLVMVQALEGIAEEVKSIKALEAAGQYEAALEQLDKLAANNPNNPFLRNQRVAIEARILERDYNALVAQATKAEAEGRLADAIKALEAAIALKPTAEMQKRLVALQEQYKAVRLEQLLVTGYDALKAGRYEVARDLYKEAIALEPNSKEARTGLEKASSLYLANIRYTQNIANVSKYIKEGRYPLAAKFFNDAMASRPSTVPPSQIAAEQKLRTVIDAQSQEVSVTVESDKRTYVSIIGVQPPDRFKVTELNLFPDVYIVKGTRSGYKSVEIELKVDATKQNQKITVECTEKL